MTPSSAASQDGAGNCVVVDTLGRHLSLRRLNALDKLRLFKAAGPDLAQNPPWLGMAMLAASISAIDDVPVPTPSNELQIEALIARLGDPGLAATSEALELLAEPTLQDAARSAGNSPGTPT